MKTVTLAKTAGFCFGVKRAVEMVYQEADKKNAVYTYGPIIHNEEVVSDLEKKGVQVINEPDEVQTGTVIIRSHGVAKNIYDSFDTTQDVHVMDATCPFVKKIHKIVEEQSKEGRQIVVIGNSNHPEVEGIIGWANQEAIVIETEEQAENFWIDQETRMCIVAQTTFNYKKFKELVEIISKKGYDILAVNTICNATEERQTEARELSSQVEAMIVIGGKHSSNSQKLFEICKNQCENTYFIQTVKDLPLHELENFQSLGITAGASTPNNIIQEVLLACRK